VALIFSGVMGVLGLLSEKIQKQETQMHEPQIVSKDEAIAIQIEQEILA